ncbi:MAG: hypothetical protein QCI00_05385, partial [Candidatus Thermoplasmatota archaeon]|nr:hypothetical protein [Candidatus Thermoplasmatota archaeon]
IICIILGIMVKRKHLQACCGGTAQVGKSMVRNASKSMEKTMINQATSLFKNPLMVLPECKDTESEKRFSKVRKQLEKVDKEKDDVKKLEKLAKKKNLAGAVAGTLLIHHSQKAPFLAVAKLPTGNVCYAQRGEAPKEQLIAVQHTDDPFFRILGVRSIAQKYHLHIYSWDSGFISTGHTAQPPESFIDFVINTLKYTKEGNVVHCKHLSKKHILEEKLSSEPYLHIQWRSANVHIGICKNCASKDKNTLFSLTKYLIADDIKDDFSLAIIGSILTDEPQKNDEVTLFTDEYYSGKLSDYQLIDKNMNHRWEQLEEKDQQVYIISGNSYGSADAFIDALNPNIFEKKALQTLVKLHQKAIIVSDATSNDVLTMFWDPHGFDILFDITKDEQISHQLLSLSETPSVIVKTAFEIKKKRDVLQDLPQYSSLPELAKYTDDLARLYRIEGKEKLFSALRSLPNHPKKKAIAYGMLLVINKHTDVKWKFSKIDIESGEFLKPYLLTLLQGSPSLYHETLQQVISSSGFLQSLDDYKIS